MIDARSGARSRRFLARSARTVPRMPSMTRPREILQSPPDRHAGSHDPSGRTQPPARMSARPGAERSQSTVTERSQFPSDTPRVTERSQFSSDTPRVTERSQFRPQHSHAPERSQFRPQHPSRTGTKPNPRDGTKPIGQMEQWSGLGRLAGLQSFWGVCHAAGKAGHRRADLSGLWAI
jgi:hypothetical protein